MDMSKSANDLNCNYDLVEKNMILKENIQFIERIGEGKLGTGNIRSIEEYIKIILFSF
jgi:hypothetical protein